MNTLQRIGVVLLTALGLAACGGTEEIPMADTQMGVVDEYQICVSDVLLVSVWGHPDLSGQTAVRPDGKISVPLIGDVQAAGFGSEQLADDITTGLAEYVRDPQVTVSVTDPQCDDMFRVRLTGEVQRPLSVPFRQGLTVLDLVLEAGGVTEFAAPNRTKLYRTTDAGVKVIKVKLGDILNKGKLDTNYALQPQDVLTVPERLF